MRFPPYFAAYERQLAKQRYYSRQRFTHPETTIRAKSSRRAPPPLAATRAVPIEVRRFGVGHRRPDGPPGTTGIEGQVIESGRAGVIAELAFGRRGADHPAHQPQLPPASS